MTTAFDRVPSHARPIPPKSSSLANWTLVRTRGHQDIAQLQGWVANEASAEEIGALLLQAPTLLYSSVEYAIQKRWLSKQQTEAALLALAEERACHVAISVILQTTPETLWRDDISLQVRRSDCALSASGAIAGFWACQVHMAASIEKAILRLGLPRELLQYKRKHSARCARNLIAWGQVSRLDLQTFPGTHRVASGITAMVDKYCSLLTSPAVS